MRKAVIISVVAAGALVAGGLAWWRVSLRPDSAEKDNGVLYKYAEWRELHPSIEVMRRGELLGILQVPRLGLAVPLVEGSDGKSLELGAGHIPRTAFPGHHGNAGIAAHRDTCFRALRFIKPHDDIVITTPGGTYDYVVSGTEIVQPTDNKVLSRTPTKTLTLVTCYPFFYAGDAPKRFIVHGVQAG